MSVQNKYHFLPICNLGKANQVKKKIILKMTFDGPGISLSSASPLSYTSSWLLGAPIFPPILGGKKGQVPGAES